MNVTRRARAGERGQAAVEFALTIVLVFFILVAVMELLMFVHTYNALADSAKEGVRYAIVHGNDNTSPSGPACPCAAIDGAAGTGVVKTFAQFAFHDTSAMTVNVTYPDTTNPPANQPPNRVRVVVSYPYQPFFGLSWPSVTVYAAAEGRIMY